MKEPNFLIRFALAILVRVWVVFSSLSFLLGWDLIFSRRNCERLRSFLGNVPTGVKRGRYNFPRPKFLTRKPPRKS